jgi:anti-anti-sigma factor
MVGAHHRLDSAGVEGRSDFSVDVEALDDRVVIRIAGELDLATAPAFDDALRKVPDGAELVVDLSNCTFLDSTGMRSLIAVAGRLAEVAVVAQDAAVVRTLEISGLDTVVAVHPSLDDAR